MTGFRVGLSGAQGVYGVTPDITTLGKIIGGGLPLAALEQNDIINKLSPRWRYFSSWNLIKVALVL